MIARAAVVAEALAWENTPYHSCADVRAVGVDCAMLLVRVFAAVGAIPADFDPRPYAADWHLHRGEEKFAGWLEQFADQVDAPELADVVVWRYGRALSHAAIVIGVRGEILHASRPARAVVRGNLSETELRDRESRIYRVRGLEV